jgi:hypothetical protein
MLQWLNTFSSPVSLRLIITRRSLVSGCSVRSLSDNTPSQLVTRSPKAGISFAEVAHKNAGVSFQRSEQASNMYFNSILTALVLAVPIVAVDLPTPTRAQSSPCTSVYPGRIRTTEKGRSSRAGPKRRVLRHAAPVSSSLSSPFCCRALTARPQRHRFNMHCPFIRSVRRHASMLP